MLWAQPGLYINDTFFVATDEVVFVEDIHRNVNVQTSCYVGPDGLIDNSGTITLTRDWVDSLLNPVSNGFARPRPGWVVFARTNQEIRTAGPEISTLVFNNLRLVGDQVQPITTKSFLRNAATDATSLLDLTTSELHTNRFVFTVLNPDTQAVRRTWGRGPQLQGFVSSDSLGRFRRVMDTTLPYYFPVGDPGNATSPPRYRPAEVTPTTNATQTMGMRFINYPPDLLREEGNLGKDFREDTICEVADYYYWTELVDGTDPVDLRFTYNSDVDSIYDTLIHWASATQIWTTTPNTTMERTRPGQLSGASTTNWSDFGNFDTSMQFTFGTVKPLFGFTYQPVPPRVLDGIQFTANELPRNFMQSPLYSWNFGDGNTSFLPDPLHVYDQPGTYDVELTVQKTQNDQTCTMTQIQTLEVRPRGLQDAPNAFYPSDRLLRGRNNIWRLYVYDYNDAEMWIFDRWGKVIIRPPFANNRFEWDGQTANGQECPEGVYLYRLRLTGPDGVDESTGTITLIR